MTKDLSSVDTHPIKGRMRENIAMVNMSEITWMRSALNEHVIPLREGANRLAVF